MNCPYCASTATKEQTKKTTLGYRTFRCSDCKRAFNEGTGGAAIEHGGEFDQPLQTHLGLIFSDDAVQTGLLFPE